MYKNNNNKTIRNLAMKAFHANKKRNQMTVLAIMLTTILFTALFTLGIGAVDAFQTATLRQVGTDGHAAIKYVDDQVYNNVKDHPLVDRISYNRLLAERINNQELLKRHGEFWYMDETARELGFIELAGGSVPEAENEIIADTRALELLGVPLETGAPVTLSLTVHGEQIEREFILSGWWESDPAFDVSFFVSSEAYVEAHQQELTADYQETYDMTGIVNIYIMFSNTLDMEGKLEQLLSDSGYQKQDPDAAGYVDCNLNWAYISSGGGTDPLVAAAMAGGLLIIAVTGYLIIYNIFQISVIRDIRFYGLLKTIGTTGPQIRKLLKKQAALLALIGIPAGLILGYLIGKEFVPWIIENTIYAGARVQVKANPLIFIGAALFSLVTVGLSIRKPGKIAARVSPIEAIRYNDNGGVSRKRSKRSTDGGRLHRMALSNLGRSKKRTAVVLLSLSLSLVLLHAVLTLTGSFDMDKYLGKTIRSDFLIAHADYYNYEYTGTANSVAPEVIEKIESLPGFESGGRIYYSREEGFLVEDEDSQAEVNMDESGNYLAAVYGLEDSVLKAAEIYEGTIDYEKLKSGNYIIEGVYTDDHGMPYPESSHFDIGETVTVHSKRFAGAGSKELVTENLEFTVMAKVLIHTSMTDGIWWDYTLFLPAETYLPLTAEKPVMNYMFQIEDEYEEQVEAFLAEYTETDQPYLKYRSRQTAAAEFESMRGLVTAIGGLLALVIAFIGILNFVNVVVTGMLSRRQEFAMMQSIGMTGSQLRKMLCLEGIFYALGTMIVSFVLSTAVSTMIVRPLGNTLWFMEYRFILYPLFLCWPVLLLLAAVIPLAAYKKEMRESIVERIKE